MRAYGARGRTVSDSFALLVELQSSIILDLMSTSTSTPSRLLSRRTISPHEGLTAAAMGGRRRQTCAIDLHRLRRALASPARSWSSFNGAASPSVQRQGSAAPRGRERHSSLIGVRSRSWPVGMHADLLTSRRLPDKCTRRVTVKAWIHLAVIHRAACRGAFCRHEPRSLHASSGRAASPEVVATCAAAAHRRTASSNA